MCQQVAAARREGWLAYGVLNAVVVTVLAALLVPAVARAEPPANDNRANAEVIPTFPATIEGTTVEATVERLDPQVSKCGRVEGTIWYRIDQAPDGTVALTVQGAGLAPVLRVYNLTKNALQELDCASAKAGVAAQVAFETKRGASYLVLVGKRPGTADGSYELAAQLFLPPANDSPREAALLGSLPATVKGTTIGATTDDGDPKGCGLAGGTVWYSLKPGAAHRIVVRLHAAGDFDASLVVQRKIRSETEDLGCGRTNRTGDLVVAWDVEEGATYLLAVGQRQGSPPGEFTLQATAAQAREKAPGVELRSGGVRSSVNWLSDVNDVYWRSFTPGTTYRIAFSSSSGCANLALHGPLGPLRSISCNGYTTFTPGPDGGGRYVFEVTAPANTGTISYRLVTGTAGQDDIGVGLELPNLATLRGSLAPAAGDAVDIYHFDVSLASDVRLRLGTAHYRGFSIALLSDTGQQLSSSAGEIRRNLARGRYVVAVRGSVAKPGGTYALSLVVRQLTVTTLAAPSGELAPGSAVTFTVAASPHPDEGWIEVQIDRFDPLGGWQFNRLIRVRAPGGAISWTPPALGRWRARASYLGTLRFSSSRSGYVSLLVAAPIG
jgi:hypothetical protein